MPKASWQERADRANWDRRVREEMADYLERLENWQVFATLTFAPRKRWSRGRGATVKTPMENEGLGRRTVELFFEQLERMYYGRRRPGDSTLWSVSAFVPWERQKWGALHCHPLIGALPKGWRFTDLHAAWRKAQEKLGLDPGRAWLKPFERGRITGYVAKYITKDLTGDLWSVFGCREAERLARRSRRGSTQIG